MNFPLSADAPVRVDFSNGSWAEFASPEVRDWLLGAGLSTVAATMVCGEEVESKHPFKAVRRAQLPYGDAACQVYIKRQWRPQRWIPRLPDIIRGAFWDPIPQREWDGLWRLRRSGLDAAWPLAVYRGGRWTSRSAVVTAGAPGESLKQWFIAGRVRQLSEDDRSRLAQAIGAVVRKLVDTGWGWRGVNAKHLYPERLPQGQWRIWLIDCEGVETASGPSDFARDQQKLLRNIKKWSRQPQFDAAVAAAMCRDAA